LLFSHIEHKITEHIEGKTGKMCFEFAANKIYIAKILLARGDSGTNVLV
jgi:hypothetical protein